MNTAVTLPRVLSGNARRSVGSARGVDLAGDDQADRKAQGGPDKGVYAYAVEDARWWQQHIGRSLAYGEFSENLTTEGIEVNDALIGKRWEIGTTVFERDDISSSDDEWSHVLGYNSAEAEPYNPELP